jgi:3-oxoacyl-[acyl-carrier-protein] synthase III
MIGCFEERGEDGQKEKEYQKTKKEWDNWVKSKGQTQAQEIPEARKKFFMNILEAAAADPNALSRCIPKQQGKPVSDETIEVLNIPIKKSWDSIKLK